MPDFNAVLPVDIIKGAGILYINGSTPYGASDGGLNFDPGKTFDNTQFDGKTSDVVGLDYISNYAAKIAGSIFPFSETKSLDLEAGGASAVVSGVTTITPKAAGVELASGDYLTDVRLVFPRKAGGYAWVRFPKALITKWVVKGNNLKEAKIDIEISSRTPSTTLGIAPYVIEFAAAP